MALACDLEYAQAWQHYRARAGQRRADPSSAQGRRWIVQASFRDRPAAAVVGGGPDRRSRFCSWPRQQASGSAGRPGSAGDSRRCFFGRRNGQTAGTGKPARIGCPDRSGVRGGQGEAAGAVGRGARGSGRRGARNCAMLRPTRRRRLTGKRRRPPHDAHSDFGAHPALIAVGDPDRRPRGASATA